MAISTEGKLGLALGLLALGGAGAMRELPHPWNDIVGWSSIIIAMIGGVLLGFHHYEIRFRYSVPIVVAACLLSFAAWYFWPFPLSPPSLAAMPPVELPKGGIGIAAVGAKKVTMENVTVEGMDNGIFTANNEEIKMSGVTINAGGNRTLKGAPTNIINDFIARFPKDKPIRIFSVPNDIEAVAFATEIQQLLIENSFTVAKDVTLTRPTNKKGIVTGVLGAGYYILIAHK